MLEVSEKPTKTGDWRNDTATAERFAVIRAAVPVRIYCHAGQKTPIYDAGKTIAVGAGGAVLTLAAPVVVDELVLLIQPKSGREMVCRVNSVEASGSGVYEIVLEFPEETPDFWGVELSAPPVPPAPPAPTKSLKDSNTAVRKAEEFQIAMTSVTPAHTPPPPLTVAPPPTAKAEKLAGVSKPVEMEPVVHDAEELSAEAAAAAEASARWRAPRLLLETRVLVTFPGETKPLDCTTINIGVSSALLQLPQKVGIGQALVLTNPNSKDQITCQVRYVKEKGPQVIHAGVEFVKEAKRFWGVTFPPENWDPSERKRPPKRV